MRVITLLTDFGTSDNFVGIMKGVILSINPGAVVVDITHQVPPQDVWTAAYLLATAHRYFPPGTIHVAVVDPGVGTGRRAIVLETERAFFVAPDNGLLTPILKEEKIRRIIALTERRYWLPEPSATFHGRDVFAPVAAHLSRGVPPEKMGSLIEDPVLLEWPYPQKRPDGSIVGHVLHIDRFGNIITDIRREDLAGDVVVEIADRRIRGLRRTFAEVEVGEPLAYIGSTGRLEIAIRQGNAAETFRVCRGDELIVRG